MSKQMSISALLNGPINPGEPNFWTLFKQGLGVRDPDPLDRKGVMKLKLLFADLMECPDHIPLISMMLRSMKNGLHGECGYDMATLVKQLVFNDTVEYPIEASDFLRAVSVVCNDDIKLKTIVYQETIETFAECLASKLQLPIKVLSALFELEIMLISNCKQNLSKVPSYINEVHISECMRLIKETHDSLAQMVIAEWMWRAITSYPTIPKLNRALGPFENQFMCISSRSDIHELIKQVNQKQKLPIAQKVLHLEFKSFKKSEQHIKSNGFLDINQDTIVIFFPSPPPKLPEITVIRMKKIKIQSITEKIFAYTDCQQTPFIGKDSKNTEMKFSLSQSTKDVIKELKRRCDYASGSKQLKVKKSTTEAMPEPSKGRKRVFAKKIQDDLEELTKQEQVTKEPEPFKDTQEKDVTMKTIDSQLDEYMKNCKRMLDQFGTEISSNLNECLERIHFIQKALEQNLDQHQKVTQQTTKENKDLSIEIRKLEDEFNSRREDTIKKREKMTNDVKLNIQQEKVKFLEDTKEAFEHNAIVGVGNNLAQLQEIMCS